MRAFVVVIAAGCWTGAAPIERAAPPAPAPVPDVRPPREGTWELSCRGDETIREMTCTIHRESSDETLLTCLNAEDPEHLAVGEIWLRVDRGVLSWFFDPPNEHAPSVVSTTRRDDAMKTCVRNALSDGSAATLCMARSGALVGLGYGLGASSDLRCGRVSDPT